MNWAIDPAHSSVTFTIRQTLSKVRGEMKIKEGWIETGNEDRIGSENEDLSRARVSVVLDGATVTITQPPVALTVTNYPGITFTSKRVDAVDRSHFRLIGDLTIQGITREVVLNVGFNGEGTDSSGSRRIGFSADTTLSRKDFNLTWNDALEAGGFLLGDDVKLDIDVEAVPAAAADKVASATDMQPALAAR